MAERLKAPVLKTGKGATLSWVRIPVLPPFRNIILIFYSDMIILVLVPIDTVTLEPIGICSSPD